jgi:hypothetical protein
VDSNQAEIVEALRKLPCEVLSLGSLGGGAPDLLVSFRNRLILLEVKPPGEKQNAAQIKFAERWPVAVVRSGPEAVLAVVEAANPQRGPAAFYDARNQGGECGD